MATKVNLGPNPETFVKAVEIVLLDGTTDKLDISYIYRTRAQYAEMVDARNAELEAKIKEVIAKEEAERKANPKSAPAKITTAEQFRVHDETLAEQVLLIAKGWELADDFTKESLVKLEGKFPGSLHRIVRTYAQAVAEARQKN